MFVCACCQPWRDPGRRTGAQDGRERDLHQSGDPTHDDGPNEKPILELVAPAHRPGDYVKLFVNGLPTAITEAAVRKMYEPFGTVLEVCVCSWAWV